MAPRSIGAYHIQRDFYSGCYRGHRLKYLNISLPNGLFGSVWGTSHNYKNVGVYNMRGLEDFLFAIM